MTRGSTSLASSSIASAASAIAGWSSRRSRRWGFRSWARCRATTRSRCPSAIWAWCRRARRRRSRRGSRRSPISSRRMSIAPAFWRWPASSTSLRPRPAPAAASAAGAAHRARARRGVLVHLPASRARLAGGGGGDRPLLAARRRAAAFRLRCLLASGRLSGTARRAAGGGGAVSRRLQALRRDAPGPRRMRGLYGAGPKPHRRLGRRPSDGGPARRRNQLRKAPDDARLSRGPHRRRIARSGRRARSCAATSSTMRPSSRPGGDEPFAFVRDVYGAPEAPAGSRRGRVTGSFFHVIAEA